MKNYRYISEVDSTNILLKKMLQTEKLNEFFTLRTSFQQAGKGQMGNSWESEKGRNLLVSFLLKPHQIAIADQFVISQIISVAIINSLKEIGVDAKIKWPNDIYFGDKKLGGILIENTLRSSRIENCIVGLGLNLNQKVFKSDAPNPISVFQILKKSFPVYRFMKSLRSEFIRLYSLLDYSGVVSDYKSNLYRGSGAHLFRANGEIFKAEIIEVMSDGQLKLQTEKGLIKAFYFKEVEFII